MENRRQTYRHSFPPEEILRAELLRPGQRARLACEVLDLSLGGMRARLSQPVGNLTKGDSVVVRLLGREVPEPMQLNLSIPSRIISLEKIGEEWFCGISFLPIADPRANDDLERALSRFLLAEQRRKKLGSEE